MAPAALFSLAFLYHLEFLPQFHPGTVWQQTAEIYTGLNHAISADDRTGVDDRIAANLGSLADDRAEFFQASGDTAVGCDYRDLAMIEFHV